jgi:hypothetical protein
LKESLQKTDIISKVTNEFKDEKDIFIQFVEEETESCNEYRIAKNDIIRAFNNYCNKYLGEKSYFIQS